MLIWLSSFQPSISNAPISNSSIHQSTINLQSAICNLQCMDFYLILGVDRGATPAEIKRAYKRLARKYHPDINPGDRMAAAQFRQIAEAYETLSDPDRRRRYDAGGQ